MSLFLFGEVHKEHWKTETGTVVGLLNPNPMKQKEGYDGVSRKSEMNLMWSLRKNYFVILSDLYFKISSQLERQSDMLNIGHT